jgi:hypothetical protein
MDNTADKVWHDVNRGVSLGSSPSSLCHSGRNLTDIQRLWVDIKHKYIKKDEEEDDE